MEQARKTPLVRWLTEGLDVRKKMRVMNISL